jgi:hypothetical protein
MRVSKQARNLAMELGPRMNALRLTVARPITDLADIRSVQRQQILGGLINQYHRAA